MMHSSSSQMSPIHKNLCTTTNTSPYHPSTSLKEGHKEAHWNPYTLEKAHWSPHYPHSRINRRLKMNQPKPPCFSKLQIPTSSPHLSTKLFQKCSYNHLRSNIPSLHNSRKLPQNYQNTMHVVQTLI